MKKHRRHHHRHFDPRRERGAGVTYGFSAFGYGYGTAQSGIHDCLSGQQFDADSCPAATTTATDSGTTSGGTTAGTT